MKNLKWMILMMSMFFTPLMTAQDNAIADYWNSKQQLTDVEGRNNQIFLKQAGTAYQMLDFQQTQNLMDNAVAQNPNSIHALMNRAKFKRNFGMQQEAALDVRLVSQQNPYAADLYGYGNPYRKLNVIAYQPLLSISDLGLHNRMSYYYQYLEQAYLNDKYNDEKYAQIETTISAIENKSYTTAEQYIEELLAMHPESAIVYDLKGLVKTKLNELNEAEVALSKAVELAPDFAIAWYNLGRVAQQKGHFDKAKTYIDKAIELQSDLTKAYFDRAILYKKIGETEAAIEDYNRVISLRGADYMEAYLNRGLTRKMLGDYTGALADLEKVIKYNPNNAELYKNKGNIYMVYGKYYKAINAYSKAIQLDPNYAEAYYNRGLVTFLVHELESACADLTKSHELGYDRALEMRTYFCVE